MQLYDNQDYNVPPIKRAIVRLFLAAERAKPKDAAGPLPEHVLKAQRYLAELRQNDPKTVQAAERFFFINNNACRRRPASEDLGASIAEHVARSD